MNRFFIYKQVQPETTHPFRVLENVRTSDGVRTRVCGIQYKTLREAQGKVDEAEFFLPIGGDAERIG